MIPAAFIQDLLDRVDIVEVVGRAVKLRKAGANLVGLCPFHGEKSPSFTVSPTKQFYHCFGCQAHGSAIGFLMAHSGLGFVDAVGELAQGLGLVVPREGPVTGQQPARPNLIERLEQAAGHYQRRLREAPVAIEYLKGRGLSGRTAARFGLGYAPPGWRNLEAVAADYDDPTWEEAGLVKIADEPSPSPAGVPAPGASAPRRRYDRFRDRIMFPIRNPRGAVIGFGGRVLHKGEPKYLNSPETPLFQKGRELYGLFEGRRSLRESNTAIVVEGYMDVVMLAEHGVDNAVATLGTATTPDHVRKLLRMVDNLVFSFDGDSAGRKAAWRALQACLPVVGDAQTVAFLFLPDGADPDSFIRENGREGWARAVAGASSLSAFLFEGLAARLDMMTPEGRAAFLSRARPLLHTLSAEGLRLQMLHQTAELARIGMLELERFMAAGAPDVMSRSGQAGASAHAEGSGRVTPRSRDTAPGAAFRRAPGRTPGEPVRATRPSLERRLRLLSVCHPSLCQGLRDRLDPSTCPTPLLRWFDGLAALPPQASSAAVLESMRQAGCHDPADLVEVQQDLAGLWSGIPSLDRTEASAEFEGALGQLERRATVQAARDLVAQGLRTDDERKIHRELLATRR